MKISVELDQHIALRPEHKVRRNCTPFITILIQDPLLMSVSILAASSSNIGGRREFDRERCNRFVLFLWTEFENSIVWPWCATRFFFDPERCSEETLYLVDFRVQTFSSIYQLSTGCGIVFMWPWAFLGYSLSESFDSQLLGDWALRTALE